MPEARALKTFQSRYGLIRRGADFNCPPDYFRQLAKNGLVVESPAPKKNRSIPEAPNRGGKGEPAPDHTITGSEHPPGSGKGATPLSAPVGQASRSKTSSASGAGVTTKSIKRRPAKKKTAPDA